MRTWNSWNEHNSLSLVKFSRKTHMRSDKEIIPISSSNISQHATQKKKGNANKIVVLYTKVFRKCFWIYRLTKDWCKLERYISTVLQEFFLDPVRSSHTAVVLKTEVDSITKK